MTGAVNGSPRSLSPISTAPRSTSSTCSGMSGAGMVRVNGSSHSITIATTPGRWRVIATRCAMSASQRTEERSCQ